MCKLIDLDGQYLLGAGFGTLAIPVSDALRVRACQWSWGDSEGDIVNILASKNCLHEDTPNFVVFIGEFRDAFRFGHRGYGGSVRRLQALSDRRNWCRFTGRTSGYKRFRLGAIGSSGHALSDRRDRLRGYGRFRIGAFGSVTMTSGGTTRWDSAPKKATNESGVTSKAEV
ncbi:hypothetical protein C8R46DRAFT_1069121 [Mycena filopes]|nr:hypothetical protein C8R46DRAFT_1069121 [Mycena filopes]